MKGDLAPYTCVCVCVFLYKYGYMIIMHYTDIVVLGFIAMLDCGD